MSEQILEIANFLARWVHLYFGIFWIGTSFYFVWLDFSLRRRAESAPNVLGEAWLVHGGGFYFVEKYKSAPSSLPKKLHWFFIDSYMTWVSGFILMCLLYYAKADILLVDKAKFDISGMVAIAISIGSLGFGFLVYHILCKSPIGKNTPVLAILVYSMVLGIYLFYTQVFTDRAALLHVGAFIATIMSANVFFVIIPNQRKVVALLIDGKEPPTHFGIEAKQRSLHNNYLGLPVLLMMVSNHYPILFSHPNKLLILALLLLFGGFMRHAINLHDQELPVRNWLIMAIISGITLICAILYRPEIAEWSKIQTSAQEVKEIVNKHCIQCHSQTPTHPSFQQPPQNLVFESIDQIRKAAPLIFAQAVLADIMPLGNETGITTEERLKIGAWIKQGAKE